MLEQWWELQALRDRTAIDRAHDHRLIYLGRHPFDGASWVLATVELLKRGYK